VIVKTLRNLALIALLTFVSMPAFAQTNKIDSMMVDERRDQLLLYGDFSARSGAVTVDSVSMPIVEWETTWIRCIVPKSGRGWAGPVVVGGGRVRGPARMLTGYKLATNYADAESRSWLDKYSSAAEMGSSDLSESWMIGLRFDLNYVFRKPSIRVRLEAILYASHGNAQFFGYINYLDYHPPYPPVELKSMIQGGSATTQVIDSLDLSEGADVGINAINDSLNVTYPSIKILMNRITDAPNKTRDSGSFWSQTTPIRVGYRLDSKFTLVPIIMDSVIKIDDRFPHPPTSTLQRTFSSDTSLPFFPPDKFESVAKSAIPEVESLNVFPNPTKNRTSLTFTLADIERVNIYVSDILGRTVQTFSEGLRSAGTHLISFDTSKLPCGVYLCNMNTANGNRTVRITIVH
jgi:hypothetical protein